MPLRVSINGFGRIGRLVFRVLAKDPRFEVASINDLSDAGTLAHLLRYDSTHGRFDGKVEVGEGKLVVNGRAIRITAEKDPANLPHRAEGIDWAVESTGVFTKKADCEKHVTAGAGRVLLTVPPKDEVDALVVMGVNEHVLQPSHRIISNASCTTNCLAPMAKVLHESFGIERGYMTTVHAYTNDQRILDLVHKDLRRARSAAQNIIPTSTGAARAVGKVLPALKGKLDGTSLRVPVPNGSIVDLVAVVSRPVTAEEVNAAMKAAASGPAARFIEYSTDPLVSTDIVGNPASCIFDSLSTMANGNLVKTFAWYDNEWGYSNRVVDLMAYASSLG
ncbi:MAG: Glyceraldehyde-3-phosphate dehydrogenase [Planctomycetes bacterium]|nr:Glyceraldehyde-3-phosphate dehydrogenase [Planctomycetota bacterium]